MSLSDIAARIEGFAAAAVAEGEKELEAIVAKAEQVVEEAEKAVEPIVVTAFHLIVEQFGPLASQLVVALAGSYGAGLTGTAKANLGATSLIQAAWNRGVTLLESDAGALIKNSYVAVDDVITRNLAPAN